MRLFPEATDGEMPLSNLTLPPHVTVCAPALAVAAKQAIKTGKHCIVFFIDSSVSVVASSKIDARCRVEAEAAPGFRTAT
jgi:hypothetical protein